MRTKKIIIGMIIMVFGAIGAFSQTAISLKTGMHWGSTSFDGLADNLTPDISSLNNISFGLGVDIALDPHLSLSTGLNYKKKGFKTGIHTNINVSDFEIPVGVKAVNSINYIELPLHLKYQVKGLKGVRPYVAIGPSISYASSGYLKTQGTAVIDFTINKTELPLDSDTFNRIEWAAAGLIGMMVPYRKGFISTEIGYEKALTDFMTDASIVDLGARHHGVSFNIGYGIMF